MQSKELQDILSALEGEKRPLALATVIATGGSTYRRSGARLLIMADGEMIGAISGGCLESDVRLRAQTVATDKRACIVDYDTSAESDLLWGMSLGCNGGVRVLIEPLPAIPIWLKTLGHYWQQRRKILLMTITAGPALGNHAICSETGEWLSLPDPACLAALFQNIPTTPGLHAIEDHQIWVETTLPPLSLLVFGSGQDAIPLVPQAKQLGWPVSVIDPRPAYTTQARFPLADALHVCQPEHALTQLPLDQTTVAIIMHHHFPRDKTTLAKLLTSQVGFIGLLGSRQRSQRIIDELRAALHVITPADMARIHAPLGLDLGAESAEQIALAICAEILAWHNQRSAQPLRNRLTPIHG